VTDIDTRLRAARGLGKDETKASLKAFESLRRRGHPQAPPPIASDGWGGITEAMIKVWGRIPPYRGRGRPPTRKLPGDDWQYLQMIKHRDKRGRLMEIEAKVVFGNEQAVRQLLGENTAYAERNHLTMRHFNGRLVRKIARFLKKSPDAGSLNRMGRPLLQLCACPQVPEKTQPASRKNPVDSTNSGDGS